MAEAVGISRSSVHAIWAAFGLKPHLVEEFKLSPDPQFVDKVRDVVGLYLNPPEAAVVFCVDEKTQVQALDRNVSTHKTPTIGRWLLRHPRFSFHFTPTYSSWMNLVERWFSELTTKWLRRGTHTSVKDLKDSINAWTHNWNEDPKPFIWRKTADEILDNLASYIQRIPQTGH